MVPKFKGLSRSSNSRDCQGSLIQGIVQGPLIQRFQIIDQKKGIVVNRKLPSLHEELEIILTVHLRDNHCISLVLLQSGIELELLIILIVHNSQKMQETNFLFNKILSLQIHIVNNFGF